jgi:hypothetical protein
MFFLIVELTVVAINISPHIIIASIRSIIIAVSRLNFGVNLDIQVAATIAILDYGECATVSAISRSANTLLWYEWLKMSYLRLHCYKQLSTYVTVHIAW